jgi:hypothetical protein
MTLTLVRRGRHRVSSVVIARPQPPHPYFDHDGPLALAHRGFSLEGLENSMRAFAAAVELGYSYVETDVHATADDVLVAFHDATLDRVTDSSGVIAQLPWSTVRQARIGGVEPIPQLEELLGTWPELRVNIDVKAASAVAPTIRAIERTRAHERVCIASFSDARRHPGIFLVNAIANQGVDAERLRLLIEEEIERIRRDGVTEEELERAKNRARASAIMGRQTVMGRAEALQWHNHNLGDPGAYRTELERTLAVTADQVRDVARRYLMDTNRAVVITVPGPEATP